MGKLWTAISNTFRQLRDDAAQALADPVRDGKFAIEDSKKQIAQFTSEVAKLIASTKQLVAERAKAQKEQKKYDSFARRAAAEGKEDHVRQAAAKVEEWETRVGELKKQIDLNKGHEDKLRKQLEAARNKVAKAEQNHTTLAARQKGAEIRKQLAQASSSFSDGRGLSAIDDLEQLVQQTECEAEAIEELETTGDEELEELYGAGGGIEVDEKVNKYMAAAKK